MSIIIGLENCGACKVVKEQFPNVKYVEVKRRCADDKECSDVKKALNKFQVEHFPVILNDEMTEVLPLETLNK